MKLHAIVDDLETAQAAVDGAATVLQLRIKSVQTDELVKRGEPFRQLAREAGITFVVNDDVEAALQLEADGVHLGRDDQGAAKARREGLMLGLSAADIAEAIAGERAGAAYLGVGPIWPTPSKPDADPAIGLDALAVICAAVSIPVVAIGGVNTTNAAACMAAGAAGVAVIRAASDARSLRDAIDRATV